MQYINIYWENSLFLVARRQTKHVPNFYSMRCCTLKNKQTKTTKINMTFSACQSKHSRKTWHTTIYFMLIMTFMFSYRMYVNTFEKKKWMLNLGKTSINPIPIYNSWLPRKVNKNIVRPLGSRISRYNTCFIEVVLKCIWTLL